MQLDEVADIARGGSPRPISQFITDDPNGVNWIKIGDTEKDGKYINSCAQKIIREGVRRSRMVKKGDFLLTNSMSFGRPYILNVDGCIHDGWLVISPISKPFEIDFLYYLLSSSFAYNQFSEKAGGAVVSNLNIEKVAHSLFPLPPIYEQKRIVVEIERILDAIDIVNDSTNDLSLAIANVKTKVLELAISGKLVPQDPADEPAEELLRRINPSAVPADKSHYKFDVPKHWTLSNLGDLFNHNTGKALNRSNRDGKLLSYITTSNLYWDRFELDSIKQMYFKESEIEKCTVRYGDLLVCEGGDIGRSAIWSKNYTICIQNHIHKLRPIANDFVLPRFYYYCFLLYKNNNLIGGRGIGIQGLSSNELHKLIMPLPPFNEQKRIVAKIDELFAAIDQIQQSLE